MHGKRKAKLSKLKNDDNQLIDQVCGNQTRTLMKFISDGIHAEIPRSRGLSQLDVFRRDAYNSCREAFGSFIQKEEDLVKEKSRLPRAASAAKTQPFDRDSYLKYNSVVSHIVNGIYLQSGLIEGKIPVDDVAGELLGFGFVKASDIANFKPDKVIALLNKLKEVGKTLNDDFKQVETLEKETLEWNRLTKEHQSMGDDPQIPEREQYFKDIKALEDLMPDLKSVGGALESYIEDLDSLVTFAAKLASKSAQLKLTLDGFPQLANSLNESALKFKTAAETINSYESLKNGAAIFKPLETKISLMTTRGSVTPGSNSQNTDIVKKNIEAVVGAVELSSISITEMKIVDGLVRQKTNLGPKSKKYTDGFPNGVPGLRQLTKDVADPWISDIVDVDGSKLSKLTDGLYPLSKLADKLGTADEKLKPISSPNVRQSSIKLSELQNVMSQLPPDSINSFDVLSGYKDCQELPITADNCQASKDFLNNVNMLAQAFPTIATAAGELNFEELVKEVNDFIASLGPQDDLNAVAAKLKDNSDLKALKEKLAQVKKQFDFDELETIVGKIKAGENTDGAPFVDAWERQKRVQKCLRGKTDHFSKAEKLSQAIQVVRSLRDIDAQQYQDFELAASTISQVAQLFPSFRSTQETMKKEVKEVTTEINKLPDSDKKSKAIGQSVSSLQYAFGLKDLESSLAQLKSVGAIVEAEVRNAKNTSNKKEVVDQWGDHKKHIADLEATLAKIKEFESKIDVSNASTIGEYGSPLKNLVMIPTANINAQNKLKALDALISKIADPKNTDALEEAKKALEKIAPLDLNFSSRQSQFQNAPKAFEDFHSFLTDFLKADHTSTNPHHTASHTTHSKPESTGLPTWGIVLICLGIFALACSAVGSVALCIIKKREKKKEEEERAKDAERAEEQRIKDEAAQRAREEEQREEQRVRDEQQRRLQELEDQNAQANRERENAVQGANDARREAERQREQRENAEQRVERMEAKDERARHAFETDQRKREKQAEDRKKNLKEKIPEWIKAQRFIDEDQAIVVTKNNMKNIYLCSRVDIKASTKFLGAKKHRYPYNIPCKVDTAVSFTTKAGNHGQVRVHANYVDSKSQKKKFIATQAPIPATFEDFWLMVLAHKTEYIVMLCPPEEKGEKYDEYFNPKEGEKMDCDNITVNTVETSLVLDGLARKWTIEVVDKKYGYKKQTVTLFQHLGWPDREVPNDIERTCKLMDMVNKSKNPVIVHCSAGIGRTATFIGLDVIMEEVENCTALVPIQAVNTLREFRAGAVQNGQQLVWLLIAVGYRLSKKYGVNLKHYDAQYKFFKNIQDRLVDMDNGLIEENKKEREKQAEKRAALKKEAAGNNRVRGGADDVVDVSVGNNDDVQAEDAVQLLAWDQINERMAEFEFSVLDYDDYKYLVEMEKEQQLFFEEILLWAQLLDEEAENQEHEESDLESCRSMSAGELRQLIAEAIGYEEVVRPVNEQGVEPEGEQDVGLEPHDEQQADEGVGQPADHNEAEANEDQVEEEREVERRERNPHVALDMEDVV